MSQTSIEILFDKFEIIDCLKKDGQAAVYLANHIYLGKKIILKTLDTSGLADNTILERFKREAKILAKLDNENIIKVLDFGTFKNFFYISFEHFESVTLREIIKNNKLSDNEKLQLLIQLLKALSVAHQNQIIHRDIKPENILVNSNLELKIADFGLALVMNETNITNSSSIVGTPSYMAPEQIHGEKTRQTDLFAVGLVAFELFTGNNPVLGEDITATINNIINFNENIVNDSLEKFPEIIRTSIISMLHKNLTTRAKTANEVLGYLGIEPQEVKSVIEEKTKSNRKKVFIYSIAGALLILTVIVFLMNNKSIIQLKGNDLPDPKAGLEKTTAVKNDAKKVSPGLNKKNDAGSSSAKENNSHGNIITPGTSENLPASNSEGKLNIDCYPWANVYIDGKKLNMTPLNISLQPGKHSLELVHPDYPPYFKTVDIMPGDSESIKINFEDITGKLECNINPWGEIYINNKLIGTTPLRKPVALSPGKYSVVIKNKYYNPVTKEVTISAKKTAVIDFNFEK